ncbi:forkhead box protein E3-like [Vidua chalybeata]|uniref:forkhead box protein E3-like n=1 Tax=Vidua chalybeata TaxID=81927 RepID=UPI0023A88091|nr:forkhead box protein E3-like [Vidua chalybeata]
MAETDSGEWRAEGTGPGTGPGTESITEPGTAGCPQRPPYSFVALITMAIRASPGQRLPLCGIYAYIAERFPFYRGPNRRWQNSVRHNLSLNPCFRRLPCRHGRAGEWALDPAFQDIFPGGNYLRRRRRRLCRRPSASLSPPSGIPPGPAAPRAPPPSEIPSGSAAPWPPPPSGIPPGPAEPPQLPETCPGPAALWPAPPRPVPSGWPQGPWAALLLPRWYPELPARGPPVSPGPPLPLPACDPGARLSPAFR